MASLLLSVEDSLRVSTLVRAGHSSSAHPFKIRFPNGALLTVHNLIRWPCPLSWVPLLSRTECSQMPIFSPNLSLQTPGSSISRLDISIWMSSGRLPTPHVPNQIHHHLQPLKSASIFAVSVDCVTTLPVRLSLCAYFPLSYFFSLSLSFLPTHAHVCICKCNLLKDRHHSLITSAAPELKQVLKCWLNE